jgi:hypothetical protein
MAPYTEEVAPGRDIVPVTPSDTSELPDGLCKSLLITGDGTLTVKVESGTQRGPFNVYAGQYFLVRVLQVMDTGTDCDCAAIY